MPADTPTGRVPVGGRSDLLRAVAVARWYFLEDRTKVEIAKELGISRFKVARLLELARNEGVVKIEIAHPFDVDQLGQRLRDSYGLREAWVVETAQANPLAELGQLGALMISDLVSQGDYLGISWGRTMRAVVDALHTLPSCSVVQVAGGLPDQLRDGALELVRRLGELTSGTAYPLHAPLFVAHPGTAKQLREDASIERTLAVFNNLTTVVLGLGGWDDSPVAAMLTPQERQRLEHRDVIAEVCGLFVGRDGSIIDDDLTQRAIAISATELHAVPNVVAVAGGNAKGAALQAVLRTGLISHVVTDQSAAVSALAQQEHPYQAVAPTKERG